MDISQQAVEFIERLFHIYLEERDFDAFLQMLDENISWIGAGSNEVCQNLKEAQDLIEIKKSLCNGNFKILEQWYKAVTISDEYCTVYGELSICENEINSTVNNICSRFSMICRVDDEEIKLIHAHFSAPRVKQCDSEFIYNCDLNNYSILHEKSSQKGIKILKDKVCEIQELLTNMQVGVQICKYEKNFPILYVNEGLCNLIGYSINEITEIFHNNQIEMLLPLEVDNIEDDIITQLKFGNIFAVEYRIKKKDGALIWILEKGLIVTASDGERQVQCVLTDITKQRLIKEELQIRSLEMQSICDNAEVAIIKGHIKGFATVDFINTRALKILGYTIEQYKQELGDKFSNFVLDDDIKKTNKKIKKLFETGGPISLKIRVRCRDGHVKLLGGYGVAITDDEGKKIGIYTFQDVTQEEANKKLLINKVQELMVCEKRYEIGMQNSSGIIFNYGIESKLLIYPQGTMKKFGLPDIIENPIGKVELSEVIHPNSIDVFIDTYKKINDGAKFVKSIVLLYDINGNESINEIQLTNIFDDKGKPTRVIGLMTDITEKVMLERERKYTQAMMCGKVLAFDANVTRDNVTYINKRWAVELGIPNYNSFSQVIDFICENWILSDDVKTFKSFFSKDIIKLSLNKGESQTSIEYLGKDVNNNYVWLKNTINIIEDDITNDIKIRCYIKNINERKKKEVKVLEEQYFYEAMTTKAITVYEVNFTRNKLVSGYENWYERFGIEGTSNYSQMIAEIIQKAIYPEDKMGFNNCHLRENILDAYKSGKRETYCEYRRLNKNLEYIWVSCSTHLFDDPQTDEIKGFCYVKDINEEKEKQLELIYKSEHDSLTKFYNKLETQQKIDKFLESSEGKLRKHAFFMFDIDYFKKINDNFGHSFGDAILSQISKKVQGLFREDDILGRIGGDEFIVLMKNIPSVKLAFNKAKELCSVVRKTYIQKGKKYVISVSIGVAIFNEHGKTYEELYNNADTALYVAKEHGRNQFICYDNSMTAKDYLINPQ